MRCEKCGQILLRNFRSADKFYYCGRFSKCGQILLRTIFEVRTNYCGQFSKCGQILLRMIFKVSSGKFILYIYSLVSSSETLHNKLILIGANLFWNAIKWRSSGVRSQKSSALVRILVRCEKCGQILLRTIFEVRTNSTADDFRSADKFYCGRFSKCGQILLRTIFEVRTNSTADDFRSADKFYCGRFSKCGQITADDFRSADKFYCGRFSKCGQILLRTIFKVRTNSTADIFV